LKVPKFDFTVDISLPQNFFAVKITPAPQKSPPLKNLTGQLLKLTSNLDSLQNFKPENIFLR